MTYRPGDIVQWVVGHTAGEAHVVGHPAPDEGVVVIAMGSIFT